MTAIKLNIVTVNILFNKCLLNFIRKIYSTFKTLELFTEKLKPSTGKLNCNQYNIKI